MRGTIPTTDTTPTIDELFCFCCVDGIVAGHCCAIFPAATGNINPAGTVCDLYLVILLMEGGVIILPTLVSFHGGLL